MHSCFLFNDVSISVFTSVDIIINQWRLICWYILKKQEVSIPNSCQLQLLAFQKVVRRSLTVDREQNKFEAVDIRRVLPWPFTHNSILKIYSSAYTYETMISQKSLKYFIIYSCIVYISTLVDGNRTYMFNCSRDAHR